MKPRPTPPITPALTPVQSAQAHERAEILRSAAPTMTVDGFAWLHAAIFVGIDAGAGQLRTHDAALDGFHFARTSLIASCLKDRFAELIDSDGYRTPDRAAFYNRLAYHLSELHAIAPFSVGNLRTIATHGEQLARAAGHRVAICSTQKSLWDRALYAAFVHREVGAVAALLSGTPAGAAPGNDDGVGICGTARLADRFLPRGRRQFMYLAVAQQLLDDHLVLARAQAKQRVSDLNDNNAPRAEIDAAHRDLVYLDHPKGAGFQLGLLGGIGVRRIEVIARPDQSALERIREIAYGLMIALGGQPRDSVEDANWRLLRPHYVRYGSPHQARMADQFLRNSAALNRSDPRFAAAQRMVDRAGGSSAQLKGRDAAAMHAVTEHLRRGVANRIRTGEVDIGGDGEVTSRRRLA